ncbi:TasA family protein [Homoserinibacter gongjuensis]|nr:TasA family protein [Homoserinibacter gongjuensis]
MSEATTASALHAARPRSARARKVGVAAAAVVGAMALAAGGVYAGAYFTSQATVGGQTVGTATVEIAAGTATSSAVLAVPSLLPGDTETTVITLENTGSEDIYYTVSLPATAGDDALEDALQVTVVAGAETHTRSLTAWQGGAYQYGVALGDGESIDLTVSVALAGTADDTLQGLDAGFAVTIDAIQARNHPVTAGWVA